jgi:hypothetical protein
VIKASVMPDDDNALTIMKGNGTNVSGLLDSGLALDLDISSSSISGFRSIPLNATSSATLTINKAMGQNPPGTQYDLSYQRLL